MERPKSSDFRRALENLGTAREQARRAFERLGRLRDLRTSVAYEEHGCPFGEGRKEMDLWREYEQYTTVN